VSTSQNAGSDALQWLDLNVADSLLAPDEAFDWVFMLKDGDWPLLESLWFDRPPEWREALAYVLCEGPVQPSQRLLVQALFDPHKHVAVQAADTLAHHREIEQGLPPLPPAAEERVQQLLRGVE
jgi:hypothetical protein